MAFEKGNRKDNKHYWLTPSEIFDELNEQYDFDFDPCPYPKPDDFDGLKAEWGESNYVNPPFGSYTDQSDHKKKGPTAWANKAIKEFKKGKRVIYVYPIDKWVLKMLETGAKVRNLKDIHWCSTEDGESGTGTGRHVACFILDPPDFKRTTDKKLLGPNEQPNKKTEEHYKIKFD